MKSIILSIVLLSFIVACSEENDVVPTSEVTAKSQPKESTTARENKSCDPVEYEALIAERERTKGLVLILKKVGNRAETVARLEHRLYAIDVQLLLCSFSN